MTAAAHWLLTTVTVELLLFNVCTCQGQSCSMGFPLTVSQCTSGCGTREWGIVITRIIPDMNFTCTGTVTAWRAAGIIDTGRTDNAMLSIWRRESMTYRRVSSIELGVCGGTNLPEPTGSNIYECTLPENMRVSVQPGDIVGIEIARNNDYRFRLYFDSTNGGPTNYEFSEQLSTFTQNQLVATSPEQDQPQISLTVEPIFPVPNIQPLTTTQDSTTNLAMTQSSTTAEDSSTAAPPEPLTTTGALITDAAVTSVGTGPTRSATEPPTTSDVQTTQATRDPHTTMSGSDSSATTEAGPTMNNPTTMEDSSRPTTNTQSQTQAGLIIGAVVGGVIGIILLLVLAILILALVSLSRKYKSIRDQETRTATAQNADILNVEMEANQSYIPVFRQISTETNTAYGEMVNQDNNDGYLTIIASTEDIYHSGN